MQRLLDDFHALTEFEIKASNDSAKDNPSYQDYATIHNLAIMRCREILAVILEGNKNE